MAKTKLKQTEQTKIENFYLKKIEEFNKFTLEELKVIFNEKRLNATEKRALLDIVNTKLQQRKEETIAEKIEQIKSEKEENLNEDNKEA